MAQMVEYDLAKVLEDLRVDIKENNRKLDEVNTNLNNKLDRLTEITNKKFDEVNANLTEVKINQAKLQGKVEILQVIIGTLLILVFTVILKVFDLFPKA